MIIHIAKREDPYVQIDKKAISDRRLSWKARGLLGYLLSKPPDWNVSIQQLLKEAPDGRDSLQSGLQELRKFGYAHYKDDPKGSFWTIMESPCFDPNYKRDQDRKAERKRVRDERKKQLEENTRNPVFGMRVSGLHNKNVGASENEEDFEYKW